MPDVEDKAEDHKDPSPTGQSAGNRVVGKDVEQGRIRKHDQPEERDEEAVESPSTQFVKIQTSARATLGANLASSASRHPIRRPFPPAQGVSLSTEHIWTLLLIGAR